MPRKNKERMTEIDDENVTALMNIIGIGETEKIKYLIEDLRSTENPKALNGIVEKWCQDWVIVKDVYMAVSMSTNKEMKYRNIVTMNGEEFQREQHCDVDAKIMMIIIL